MLKNIKKIIFYFKKNNYLYEVNRKLDNIEKNICELKSTLKRMIQTDAKPKTVLIRIRGGLVDQINYYFCGRALDLTYGDSIIVKYDTTWFKLFQENQKSILKSKKSFRNFELLKLFPSLNILLSSKEDISSFSESTTKIQPSYRKISNFYFINSNIIDAQYNFITLDISPSMMNEIKNEFSFDEVLYPLLDEKNLSYYNEIKNSFVSVGVHIRRTDYITQCKKDGYKMPDQEYFLKSIKNISRKIRVKKAHFFIFSDDIFWVKEKLLPKINNKIQVTIVDCNTEEYGFLDFYLLMQTNHQIASRGRFCLASHYFNSNENKILITPHTNTAKPIVRQFKGMESFCPF